MTRTEDQQFEKAVEPTGAGKSTSADLGAAPRPAGEYELGITPLEVQGGARMKRRHAALAAAQ